MATIPKDGPARKIGFLAQDLAAVLPEVVHFPLDGSDYYGINYAEITALLTAAVKRQQEALSFFSVKQQEGGVPVLAVNGMLEADVIRAREIATEKLKAKRIEAEDIDTKNLNAKNLKANKVLSGESVVITGNGCSPIFAMETGAVYDVRIMSAQGGWGHMRIGYSEAGANVQDRKMSENGLGLSSM